MTWALDTLAGHTHGTSGSTVVGKPIEMVSGRKTGGQAWQGLRMSAATSNNPTRTRHRDPGAVVGGNLARIYDEAHRRVLDVKVALHIGRAGHPDLLAPSAPAATANDVSGSARIVDEAFIRPPATCSRPARF